jgi:hypothetical protein
MFNPAKTFALQHSGFMESLKNYKSNSLDSMVNFNSESIENAVH